MILDGKAIADDIKGEVKKDIQENNISPCLAVVLVGDNLASKIYVNNKIKACEVTGIKSKSYFLSCDVSQDELNSLILSLNKDININGILLQMPLPNHIDSKKTISLISPNKDVDGLTPNNLGNLALGESNLVACTPSGIMELISRYDINLCGKNVCIINRSNLVGKPLALLMLEKNATVTICHSKTENLKSFTKKADVVVTAVGKSNFLKSRMIKKNAIVIDVSINRHNGKLCGDACFKEINKKASFVTPVPKGIGPMTIAMLMKNTLKAYYLQNNI